MISIKPSFCLSLQLLSCTDPYEFYQKYGFAIAGVMPDANGWGKPDIFMAKQVASSPQQPYRAEREKM